MSMYAYVVLTFILCETATSLPRFSDCEATGWSCTSTEYGMQLVFTCDDDVGWDAFVNLEDEAVPWFTVALTVRDCRTVKLKLGKKMDLAPAPSLTIESVDTLELVDPAGEPYLFSNPPKVEFKNIGKIPKIPSRTFTSASFSKAESIVMLNVTIQEISSRAFYSVTDASLLMDSVTVNLIDTDAINIENTGEGFVRIQNSTFGTLEPRSFVLISPKVEFVDCTIGEIREQSLEITAESFIFQRNAVTKEVMSAGFTVSAVNISFVGNRFTHLQNRAFEEVTHVRNNLMRSDVKYEFAENYVNWAEQGSLQPNYTIYEESSNHIQLRLGNNSFNCTCALLGWLVSSTEYSSHEELVPDLRFRKLLLDNRDNVCANTSCRLPVRYVNFLLDSTTSRSCATIHQVKALCEHTVSSQRSIFSSASFVFLSLSCLAFFAL